MATHTEPDLEAARTVTRHFPIFLGLRLLPLGLWFVLVPLPGLGQFASWRHRTLLGVALVATWAVHRWYVRRYGSVEPERLRFGRSWALLLGVLAAWTAMTLGPRFLDTAPAVVVLVLLLFATAIAFALPRSVRGGRDTAVPFLLAAGAGAALLVAVTRQVGAFASLGDWFSLTIGLLLALAGVLEHRSLVRALGRASDRS